MEVVTDSALLVKSKAFALDIIRVCNEIKQSRRESVLTNQLIRSGTSIGANVSEAERGQSKADFNAKLNIALKEANETYYWLRLLHQTDYLTDKEFKSMETDIDEIIAILVSICKKTNQK